MKQVAEEVIKMAVRDQAMRQSGKWDDQVDRQNTERMKQIIKKISWPTISKVGSQASFDAWLLVQHADHDLKFQKSCLQLMQQAPIDEVLPKNIAYLEDRILVTEGKLQKYGTQLERTTNALIIKPVTDPDNLDRRRASVGLEPIDEYLKTSQRLLMV